MTKPAWIAIGIAILLALLFAFLWDRERKLAAQARRDTEAERLRSENLIVANQQLKIDVETLTKGNADLKAALEKALAAAPGAKPTSSTSASTGQVPVVNLPDDCLLRSGDTGEATTEQITLTTKEGNKILVGDISCWRVKPEPKLKLFGGVLKADVTDYDVVDEVAVAAKIPGWGAGAYFSAGKEGWAIGPAVSPPPLKVLGLNGELTFGFGVGSNSNWQLGGTGLVRW